MSAKAGSAFAPHPPCGPTVRQGIVRQGIVWLALLLGVASATPAGAVEPLPPGASRGIAQPEARTATSLDEPAALPDAPSPSALAFPASGLRIAAGGVLSESPGDPPASGSGVVPSMVTPPAPRLTTPELDDACQSGVLRGKPCKVHWLPILWESLEATAMQNSGNIALDHETRLDLTNNPFWATYFQCVKNLRYRQWRDDDDFNVDYIGHGLQGGIAGTIFEQNDPKGRGLVYVNNGNYWRSRLKAMAWTTVYEIQWKIGPASEASIGNSGRNTYDTPRVHGRSTNETGFQDFVDTPIVGFWWNVGEDAIDRFLMPHIWSRTHNRILLTALVVITPCKGAGNLLRYKPLYYRDFPITPLR